jgi:hypothetical protein
MNEQLEQAIFSELSDLEKTLAADFSGDRARAIMAYFDGVAAETQGHVQSAAMGAERQLAAQLTEGFHAAQRIVQKVWEALHGTPLPA